MSPNWEKLFTQNPSSSFPDNLTELAQPYPTYSISTLPSEIVSVDRDGPEMGKMEE